MTIGRGVLDKEGFIVRNTAVSVRSTAATRLPGRGRGRGRTTRGAVVAALGAVTLMVVMVVMSGGPASAKAPRRLPADLAPFAHCPIDVHGVTACLFSSTTSTTFQIGSTTVSSTSPTTVSLGLITAATGAVTAVLPDDGSPALQTAAIALPGGLTGISGLDGGVLAVSVTPQLVGVPGVNLGNLLSGNGPGLTLPIDVLISTPSGVLGSGCTIADAADPIMLDLTTGTTDPPAPATPVSGSPGTLTSSDDGLLTITGMKLVDNAFAVPTADNCGPGSLADEVLDVDKGLPSAAGSNSAVLAGSSETAPSKLIRKYLR
ncbi:MAG: hypothetical protein ACRDY1_00115 [Acidimicrobiales bacterium]